MFYPFFILQRIFQRCLVHLKYTKRLSTTDQLLNQRLMLQKVLRNLKAKPWGYDYTGVLVLGKKKTHLSIVWLTIVLQPLRENSYWSVSGQVFRFEAHVFSKDWSCMKKNRKFVLFFSSLKLHTATKSHTDLVLNKHYFGK